MGVLDGFMRQTKRRRHRAGRLVMLLDHVFTRDVSVSTSTRIERKAAMSGRVIVKIWQLPAPGLSAEALGADVVYGQ